MWAVFVGADGLRVRVDEDPLTVEGAPAELHDALVRLFSEPVEAIEGWFDRFEGQWADRVVVRNPGEPKHFDSVIDRVQRELGLRLEERGGWKRDPTAPPVPS
jgi:hypothetical protein